MYEGRSESSNNCLIIPLIIIVKQKETYLIKLQHVLYKCCENQDDAQRHNKNMFITKAPSLQIDHTVILEVFLRVIANYVYKFNASCIR